MEGLKKKPLQEDRAGVYDFAGRLCPLQRAALVVLIVEQVERRLYDCYGRLVDERFDLVGGIDGYAQQANAASRLFGLQGRQQFRMPAVVGKRVEEQHIDPLGSQPLQRAAELLVRTAAALIMEFGDERERAAAPCPPVVADELLGFAVGSRGVEAAEACSSGQVQDSVGFGSRRPAAAVVDAVVETELYGAEDKLMVVRFFHGSSRPAAAPAGGCPGIGYQSAIAVAVALPPQIRCAKRRGQSPGCRHSSRP